MHWYLLFALLQPDTLCCTNSTKGCVEFGGKPGFRITQCFEKVSVWQTDFQLAGSYHDRSTSALPSHLCQSTTSTVKQCLKFCRSNPCLKSCPPAPAPPHLIGLHICHIYVKIVSTNKAQRFLFMPFADLKILPTFHFSSFFTIAEVCHIFQSSRSSGFSPSSALSSLTLAWVCNWSVGRGLIFSDLQLFFTFLQ